MMYLVKQGIGALTAPLVVALLIAVVAAIYRLRERPRVARWLLVGAAIVAYLGASAVVGDALLGPLERQYPPLRDDQPLPAASYIVVLGSGYAPHDAIPVTAALDREGLVRIVEGVRLMRRLGTNKLVVSGGAPPGQAPPALGYADLARGLGVADSSLVVLDSSLDTAAESRAIVELLGKTPFILVTSAYQMLRAMRLMHRAGARPIAAPTGQLSGGPMVRWRNLLPTTGGLQRTELALHEYLGLAAMTVGIS